MAVGCWTSYSVAEKNSAVDSESHLKVIKTKREYIGKKQIGVKFENIFFLPC